MNLKIMSLSDFNQKIYLIITTEADKKNASKLADLLLRKKLVPCITFQNVESNFWWEGDIKQSDEVQLLIKCREENVNKVLNKINKHHSYNVPEIIYFCVSANRKFYDWVNSI